MYWHHPLETFVILHFFKWLFPPAIVIDVDKYDCPGFFYEDLEVCSLCCQNIHCSCTFYFDVLALLPLEMFIRCFPMSICHLQCMSCQITHLTLVWWKKCTCVRRSSLLPGWWSTSKGYWIKMFCHKKSKEKRGSLRGISILIIFRPHLCFFNRGPWLISGSFSPISLLTFFSFSLNVPVVVPLILHHTSCLSQESMDVFPCFVTARVFAMWCKSAGQKVIKTY